MYDESDTPEAEYGQGVTMVFQVDSDWGGRDEDSKSTTGWLVRLNNSVVFSESKIQRRVATSTVEAETNGLEIVCKEVEWYRDFLSELEIDVTPPTSVESDNAGALSLARDPVLRPRTKYFRIAQDYIRWTSNVEKTLFRKVSGKDLCADTLTKPLPFPAFQEYRRFLMGNQEIRKMIKAGKEYSSDEIGDGPARCKRVSRRPPKHVRMYQKIFKSKIKSMSDHSPPLLALCQQCSCYLEWNSKAQDWVDHGDCDQPVWVMCCSCQADAVYGKDLNCWYCVRCIEQKTKRKRKRTERFEP